MSQYTQYPFYTAYTHLHDIFGVDMAEDMFETSAFVAWRNIGNKNYRTYKAKLYPQSNLDGGYFVSIPCNCEVIESITTNYEDYQRTSSITNYPGLVNSSTEQFIESGKYETSTLYQSGRLVKYDQLGDTLYFKEPYQELNILYKGIYADEDGLPFLNFKEVEAIAAYCLYVHFYKKAYSTMDGNTFQLAQAAEQKWLKKCSQARVPEYLNQNEMDEILNAKSSWDRKSYNRTFKPIK